MSTMITANAAVQEYRRQHCRIEKERRERMNGHFAELDRLCVEAEPKLARGKRDRDAILVNAIRLLSAFITGNKGNGGPQSTKSDNSNASSAVKGEFESPPFFSDDKEPASSSSSNKRNSAARERSSTGSTSLAGGNGNGGGGGGGNAARKAAKLTHHVPVNPTRATIANNHTGDSLSSSSAMLAATPANPLNLLDFSVPANAAAAAAAAAAQAGRAPYMPLLDSTQAASLLPRRPDQSFLNALASSATPAAFPHGPSNVSTPYLNVHSSLTLQSTTQQPTAPALSGVDPTLDMKHMGLSFNPAAFSPLASLMGVESLGAMPTPASFPGAPPPPFNFPVSPRSQTNAATPRSRPTSNFRCVLDLQCRMYYCSPELKQLLNYESRDGNASLSFFSLIHPEDIRHMYMAFTTVASTPGSDGVTASLRFQLQPPFPLATGLPAVTTSFLPVLAAVHTVRDALQTLVGYEVIIMSVESPLLNGQAATGTNMTNAGRASADDMRSKLVDAQLNPSNGNQSLPGSQTPSTAEQPV